LVEFPELTGADATTGAFVSVDAGTATTGGLLVGSGAATGGVVTLAGLSGVAGAGAAGGLLVSGAAVTTGAAVGLLVGAAIGAAALGGLSVCARTPWAQANKAIAITVIQARARPGRARSPGRSTCGSKFDFISYSNK